MDWKNYGHRKIIKGAGGHGNKRMSVDHPNHYLIEIDLETVKTSGDLRRLCVTQTSEKYHQLALMWKTHKE